MATIQLDSIVVGRKKAAELLDISEWQLDKMVSSGELPHFHVGARPMFAVTKLIEWCEGKSDLHMKISQRHGKQTSPNGTGTHQTTHEDR